MPPLYICYESSKSGLSTYIPANLGNKLKAFSLHIAFLIPASISYSTPHHSSPPRQSHMENHSDTAPSPSTPACAANIKHSHSHSTRHQDQLMRGFLCRDLVFTHTESSSSTKKLPATDVLGTQQSKSIACTSVVRVGRVLAKLPHTPL